MNNLGFIGDPKVSHREATHKGLVKFEFLTIVTLSKIFYKVDAWIWRMLPIELQRILFRFDRNETPPRENIWNIRLSFSDKAWRFRWCLVKKKTEELKKLGEIPIYQTRLLFGRSWVRQCQSHARIDSCTQSWFIQ